MLVTPSAVAHISNLALERLRQESLSFTERPFHQNLTGNVLSVVAHTFDPSTQETEVGRPP